jgi:hypothetical protein
MHGLARTRTAFFVPGHNRAHSGVDLAIAGRAASGRRCADCDAHVRTDSCSDADRRISAARNHRQRVTPFCNRAALIGRRSDLPAVDDWQFVESALSLMRLAKGQTTNRSRRLPRVEACHSRSADRSYARHAQPSSNSLQQAARL